ncbi:MAG TPA: hypothetical protein VJU60_04760 [Thermoleophilaceae bacterium]|nr:hypothetical protein [Thermoleophilaceae bacterium]
MAIGAAGALILAVALADLFVTVFNYDGYRFVADRVQRLLWRSLRFVTRPLPDELRHSALSLGSAAMLPATLALWLGLEIIGFAMMYEPGLAGGSFSLSHHLPSSIGSAFYLSGGAISSLTFGDIVAVGWLYRALVDLETIIGLITFTLGLGYVVTTFGVLHRLDDLHDTVRRHAADPARPSSILSRHFRGGEPSELPTLLQTLAEKLESYDQGLRRYPVVYYFHTRRSARSIPQTFASLGHLIALLRFGLPAGEPIRDDAMLAALGNEYGTTLERLQRSFVGPPSLESPEPLDRDEFAAAYRDDGRDDAVDRFRKLGEEARTATGVSDEGEDGEDAYERYREWLPFDHRNRVLLARIADALGYEVRWAGAEVALRTSGEE